MMRGLAAFLAALLVLVMSGCSFNSQQAPVADRSHAGKKIRPARAGETDWRPQSYTVQKGDTLYAIALEYGFDYKELAEWNGIDAPYIIRIGQQLRLKTAQTETASVTPLKTVAPTSGAPSQASTSLLKTQPKAGKVPYSAEAASAPPPPVVAVKPETAAPKPEATPPKPETAAPKAPPVVAQKPTVVEDSKAVAPGLVDDEDMEWAWPTKGKLIASFNEAGNSKGLDIAGKMGQPIFASAPGKVVYSGSGLRGYGKLVIIKHNKTYLSAYAHNSQIEVKEGQSVTKGQKIAEMGNSDSDQVALHFEIRRLGKPVDPLKHLTGSNG